VGRIGFSRCLTSGTAESTNFLTSLTRSAGACIVVVALAAACGSAAPKTSTQRAAVHRPAPAGPCQPAPRAAVARFLHVAPASIAIATGTGNDGNPQCTYATRLPSGKRASFSADIYSGPQPYFVLERTIVEASQPFTPQRLSPAPQAVTGLGLEASWFPNRDQLMSTDGLKIITVTVAWPGASVRREIAVATVLSRPYLKRLTPKQATAVANGFPCGCQ
jgi:hypothetical protein